MENVSKGEVVILDKDYLEKLEMEDHFLVFKRLYTTGEDLEVFGITARCPACTSLLKGTARQAHTENYRKRIEEWLRGTLNAGQQHKGA